MALRGCYKYKLSKATYFSVVFHPGCFAESWISEIETSVQKIRPECFMSSSQEVLAADIFCCYNVANICSRCLGTRQQRGRPGILVYLKRFSKI